MSNHIAMKPRHFEILNALNSYHKLSAALVFRALPGRFSSLTRCREALQALARNKPALVHRVAYHPLTARAGRAEYIYSLSLRGAAVLSECAGLKVSAPGRQARSGLQLGHVLAINAFRLTVEEAVAAHAGLRIAYLAPEYRGAVARDGQMPHREVQARIQMADGRQVTLIPDMALALEHQHKQALFFVEIDLNTEPLSTLYDKAAAYAQFHRNRGFEEYSRLLDYPFKGFRVLLVGRPRRFARLFEMMSNAFPSGLFWANALEDLSANTLLTQPVWLLNDHHASRSIL